MLANEHLDLTDQLSEATEREIGVEPLLERHQSELIESESLRLSERLVGEIGERRPAPEVESFAQALCRELGLCASRLLDESLEAKEVELVRTDADHIAGLLRDDRVVRSERLAKL